MITCTTAITILRRERTFSRFKQSELTFLQKQLSTENKFLFAKSQLAITLKNPY